VDPVVPETTVVAVETVVLVPSFVGDEPELHDEKRTAAAPMARPRPQAGSGLKNAPSVVHRRLAH
jgi:hypothetical protein